MRTYWLGALAVVVACAGAKTKSPVVTTTSDGTTTSEAGTTAAKKGKSLVRFINTLPDGAALDLATEQRVTFYNVDYKTVTPYTEIDDNLVKFRVRSSENDSVLAENMESLGDGYRYTIIAMPTADQHVKVRILRDDVVPEPGKARVRVIQASPALTDVKVEVSGRKELLFDKVGYGSEAGYKDVDPGAATLVIQALEGSVSPLRLKNVHLTAGAAYTIVVAGSKARAVQAITFNDVVRPHRPTES